MSKYINYLYFKQNDRTHIKQNVNFPGIINKVQKFVRITYYVNQIYLNCARGDPEITWLTLLLCMVLLALGSNRMRWYYEYYFSNKSHQFMR